MVEDEVPLQVIFVENSLFHEPCVLQIDIGFKPNKIKVHPDFFLTREVSTTYLVRFQKVAAPTTVMALVNDIAACPGEVSYIKPSSGGAKRNTKSPA